VNIACPEVKSKPTTTKRELDRSLIRGLAWTGGTKWVTQLLSWTSTLIVARLLSPEDYGLVAMATVYLGLVTLFNEFGFGGFAFSCMVSGLLAAFYAAPQLRWVIIVMSTGFVITAFRTIPQSLLQRELHFKYLSLVEGSQALVQASCMVLLAYMGLRYWTLVLGGLIGTVLSTLLVYSRCQARFAVPRIRLLKSAMTFSRHILVGRVCWYVYSSADFLVAGKVLGKQALGAYTFAWTLASLPVDKITAMVGQVTPAFLSAVQRDKASLRRYLVGLTESLALATFPAACGLALVAENLVALTLGEKWQASILPMQLLALYASFRSVIPLLSQVLNVTGNSRFAMWHGVVCSLLLPASFYVGSRWGTVGIALPWLIVYLPSIVPMWWRVFKRIELSAKDYFNAVWPAINGSLIMVLVVLACSQALPSTLPRAMCLAFDVSVGAVSYFVALYIFHRTRIQAMYLFLQELRQR
jgi:O-antigen/teichoic acid export membrane protein